MPDWISIHNDDNGSLLTAAVQLAVGDLVEFAGDHRVRRVTYVMGSDRRGWRACFRDQGAVPTGAVQWRPVGGELPAVPVAPVASPPAVQAVSSAARPFTPSTPQVRVESAGASSAARLWMERTPPGGMAMFGFDSAWTIRNKGAVAALLVRDGEVKTLGPTEVTFEEVAGIVQSVATTHALRIVAVDQPLVVPNLIGRRPVEAAVSPAIGRRGGGVQPANRGRTGMFDDGAPLWAFLKALAPGLDPVAARQASSGTHALEVYPALANVALFQSARAVQPLLKYNPERATFRSEDWVALAGAIAT